MKDDARKEKWQKMPKSDSQLQILKEISRLYQKISLLAETVIGFFQFRVPQNKKPDENLLLQTLVINRKDHL